MWQNTFLTSFFSSFFASVNTRTNEKEGNWDERATVYLLLKWSRNFQAFKAFFSIETFGSTTFAIVHRNITANMYSIRDEISIALIKRFITGNYFVALSRFTKLFLFFHLDVTAKSSFRVGRNKKSLFVEKTVTSRRWISLEHFISSLANVES